MGRGVVDADRLREALRLIGVRGGEKEGGVGPHWADQAVFTPAVWVTDAWQGVIASDAALRSRFVVPRAFVEPDRAEQTTATL